MHNADKLYPKTYTGRFTALILALSLCCVNLLGCGGDAEDDYDDYDLEALDEEYWDEALDEDWDYDLDEDLGDTDSEGYDLSAVAKLNGCKEEDLNVCYSDGYLVFLGNKYSDEKITNEKDALNSLDCIRDELGLDGITLDYYRTDISPVSGYTYYTFLQTYNAQTKGGEIPAKYTYNLVKVITDKDGYTAGLSADLSHDELPEYTENDIISSKDAEEYVASYAKELMGKTVKLYSERTEFVYWDDEISSAKFSNANVIPVWAVYTDYVSRNKTQRQSRYTIWLVYALDELSYYDEEDLSGDDCEESYDGSRIVTAIDAATLDYFEKDDGAYTSELFFAGLEDAGEYTYDVDMSWAKIDDSYGGEDSYRITVPVSYSPKEQLYYMCDCNNKVAVSNYYDFIENDTTNCLVSSDPSKLTSWHFQLAGNEDDDIEYFCDPCYVVCNYYMLLSVMKGYQDRYGLRTVDDTGLPLMLCVYMISDEYPASVDEFDDNAANLGQGKDWNIFTTSPATSMGFDYGTMAHEYAHAINGALTCSKYSNGCGAVMEGYADILGEFLSYLNGLKDEEYRWLVGSQITAPIRSFEDPLLYANAKYIGGIYYVSPADEAFSDYSDSGGVHINSGCVNYLAYELCNYEGIKKEQRLTMDEDLDLWMETLYCTTHESSYEEVGHYLVYASKAMGLSDNKQTGVYRTVEDYGFLGSTGRLDEFINDEKSVSYDFKINNSTEDELEFYIGINEGESEYYFAGGVDDCGELIYRLPEELKDPQFSLIVADYDYAMIVLALEGLEVSEDGTTAIDVKTLADECGNTVEFDSETIINYTYIDEDYEIYSDLYDDSGLEDLYGDDEITLKAAGRYYIGLQDEDGDYSIAVLDVD